MDMNEYLNKHIGSEIQKARKEAGMTQEELAIKVGFSTRNALANVESGAKAVSISKIAQICEILNLETVFFLRKK
ncbi:hypothetical protein KO02_12480 [Sphingobacterium sp. ML3W]|uniref:helix-turn-helix domain-containing protein n=1 Tax=Sphingobacterium sp. ML3W TaxID=1538644 RepID=UPI0004F7EAD7|nr:helix-turn-helix transcriptional regulator [Sphingobacterium sp. ML3W]AIM37414.1 hypothetical protein KO02_12480 [Sphingobacterium sp. ML3W]